MKYIIGIISIIGIVLAVALGVFINEQLGIDACRVFDVAELIMLVISVIILIVFYGALLVALYYGIKGSTITKKGIKDSFSKDNFSKAFTFNATWESTKGGLKAALLAIVMILGIVAIVSCYFYIKSMYC